MKKEEYLAKLRDPRWQRKRLEVLQRDEFVCQTCGDATSTLHVHHRWYQRGADPWDYPLESLVTLCEGCHEDESNVIDDYCADLVSILKRGNAMAEQMYALSMAFYAGVTRPLDVFEWHVLASAINALLRSREANDAGAWEGARRVTADVLKKEAAEGGDPGDAAPRATN